MCTVPSAVVPSLKVTVPLALPAHEEGAARAVSFTCWAMPMLVAEAFSRVVEGDVCEFRMMDVSVPL